MPAFRRADTRFRDLALMDRESLPLESEILEHFEGGVGAIGHFDEGEAAARAVVVGGQLDAEDRAELPTEGVQVARRRSRGKVTDVDMHAHVVRSWFPGVTVGADCFPERRGMGSPAVPRASRSASTSVAMLSRIRTC